MDWIGSKSTPGENSKGIITQELFILLFLDGNIVRGINAAMLQDMARS